MHSSVNGTFWMGEFYGNVDYILNKAVKNKQKTAPILRINDSFMSKWIRKIHFEGSHSKFQKESQVFQPASQTAGTLLVLRGGAPLMGLAQILHPMGYYCARWG